VGGDLPAHQEGMADLAFTPDKKFLITAGKNGDCKVWDLARRLTPLRRIQAHDGRITGLAVSPDGSRFATTAADNRVKLWATATGRRLRQWDVGVAVRSMAFAPDGKHLATANANTTLYLLDLP